MAIYFSVLYPIHGFVGDNMCSHSFIICKIMWKELLKKRKPDFIIMPSFEVLHPQENFFKIIAKEVGFKAGEMAQLVQCLPVHQVPSLSPQHPHGHCAYVCNPSTRMSQHRGQDLWNPGGH